MNEIAERAVMRDSPALSATIVASQSTGVRLVASDNFQSWPVPCKIGSESTPHTMHLADSYLSRPPDIQFSKICPIFCSLFVFA